ncbi:DoxX family protein [Candidatus Peregrinibacteria bacterium]|nr:DoxX family protein [Candidatus Peregrinibacteria bacterium]
MLRPTAKWAPLVLRIVLGVILIFAGYSKIFEPAVFVEIVKNMAGNYLPAFFVNAYGYALPYVELITGIFLVLGLFTRLTGTVVALMFVSFIIGVSVASPDLTLFMDPGAKVIPNKDFAFLGMALALVLTGGGAWAVDNKMKW